MVEIPDAYICVDAGFISGVPYDQVQAPVPADNPDAVEWCQAECSDRPQCEGIFYQIHSETYALCGLFNSPIDLADAEPGKPGEQVCKRLMEP